MVKIFQSDESPVLRGKAELVPVDEISSAKIQKVIADLKKAMHAQDDAVAIAAPQIGVPLALFVVSGKVFMDPEDLADEERGHPHTKKPMPPDLICINPTLAKLSRKKELMEEGCLSVRWLYGKVSRATKATVKARDERGEPFTRGASGLLAQIFQHETDHLHGVLFIDKATDLREILPQDEERDAATEAPATK